jgi:hypothetical protein
LARCSGIVKSGTAERYAHLKDDPLRAVADRTSKRIAGMMQGNKAVPLPSSGEAKKITR